MTTIPERIQEEARKLIDDGNCADCINDMYCDCFERFSQALLAAQKRGREERVEDLEDVLFRVKQWCDAYPLDIFPEPDFKRAHELLTAGGMTLDAIGASNMRHVCTGISKIIDGARIRSTN
jgi:hypothetical protein